MLEQIKKNLPLKKVDIRNQYRKFSGYQNVGSTGWCRRFLQRHPEVQAFLVKQR